MGVSLGPNKLTIPTGTSDPASGDVGDLFYNTTDSALKAHTGNGWQLLSTKFDAVGGTEYEYVSGGTTYKVHAFTSSGTLECASSGSIDFMVVAGGGGGGGSTAGGGGAGGLIYNPDYIVAPGTYSIVIGAGGAGSRKSNDGSPNNTNGANSSAFGYTALGGGYGYSGQPSGSRLANSGGSGGGGGYYGGNDILNTTHSGAGTSGQGNRGGYGNETSSWGGAGGGGAAGVGVDMNSTRAGGPGANYSSIFGTNYGESGYFAGGGAGGVYDHFSATAGGIGGGGNGGSGSPTIATSGSANTGGGGGGSGFYQNGPNPSGGNGGSGIVLIRYEV